MSAEEVVQDPQPDVSVPGPHEGDLGSDVSLEDQTLLLIAHLMEGGKEDDETIRSLGKMTKLLSMESTEENQRRSSGPPHLLHTLIDADGFETILGYLDMRQAPAVRGHATLCTSAYLKASGDAGTKYLTEFFESRVNKATYDDLILAFSVATSVFPVVPSIMANLFLSNGFVQSLGPLMTRKRKSKKVEQACLEMVNAACMDGPCRETVKKYCVEWLEDIVNLYQDNPEMDDTKNDHFLMEDGSLTQQLHAKNVVNLAAVILAKLQAVPSPPKDPGTEERVEPATTSIEELSDIFSRTLSMEGSTQQQNSIEGLAYASLQSKVKEKLAYDPKFLKTLLKNLERSPAKSPATYGGLSVLINLTTYQPTLSEEEKRMAEIKAYANASKEGIKSDPLNDDTHVDKRCKAVFEAGVIPVLVTHSRHGSAASLSLVVSIINSLSKTTSIRGQMAQQGAVKLLVHAYSAFPQEGSPAHRITAHALARILISTNPQHVFGGSNPIPLTSAIRPLLSLLTPDPNETSRSLLPVFESLLALTNLASTDDTARNPIIRTAWPQIEELLLSNNNMVMRASVELICNLMQSPEGIAKFADGGQKASQRMHILLALADAEDFATRRAAGGALASLTEWDTAVNAILERERGVKNLLGLCKEDSEELRHRGVVCVANVMNAPGKVGEWGVEKVKEGGGVEALKECLKKSRSQEVLEITVEALKKLLGQ